MLKHGLGRLKMQRVCTLMNRRTVLLAVLIVSLVGICTHSTSHDGSTLRKVKTIWQRFSIEEDDERDMHLKNITSRLLKGAEAISNMHIISPVPLHSPLDEDFPCFSSLTRKRSAAHQQSIVSSDNYPGIKQLMEDLYLESSLFDDKTIAEADPVFVTAASSNHFKDSLKLFANFNRTVRKQLPNAKVFFFDIGLKQTELVKLQKACGCEVKRFPFNTFPAHVKILNTYAFKPLVIQFITKNHPFVVWMDASIRFMETDLTELFRDARRLGVICTGAETETSVAQRTHPLMFTYFNEEPCAYRTVSEIQSGFIMFQANSFVVENILKPWVRCALILGCITPGMSTRPYLTCGTHGKVYGDCHRFDQSALGILLYRVYNVYINDHKRSYNGPYYTVCQDCV